MRVNAIAMYPHSKMQLFSAECSLACAQKGCHVVLDNHPPHTYLTSSTRAGPPPLAQGNMPILTIPEAIQDIPKMSNKNV